jgi:hypothetical protein
MLPQLGQGSVRDSPGDLEVHILRNEVKALVARDLLVLGVSEVSEETSQPGPFQDSSPQC